MSVDAGREENISSRRQILVKSALAAAALPIAAARGAEGNRPRLKVLVAGGHPGDPEAGCGGTIARYADEGHDVVLLYLTRGEAGVHGKSAAEAAAIRTAEAQRACEILKARPLFANQIDAATEVNAARYAEFTKLIEAEAPDVVFTQWPVDHHPDHRVCAALTYEAWVRMNRNFALYFYEVDLGSDTQCFHPTVFVDVTAVEPRKRNACMAHQSQDPNGFYNKDHVPMLHFRGMEAGVKLAEAFIHHDQSPAGRLPGT